MTRQLMTMAALAWAAAAVAGNWEKPVMPQVKFDMPANQTTAPVAGGSYYMYNTDAAQFYCAGNSWGTQASVSATGLAVTLETLVSEQTGATGYALKTSKGYTFMEPGMTAWTDMKKQNETNFDCNMWNIKPAADGKYTIQIAESCQMQKEVEEGADPEYTKPYDANKYFAWVAPGTVVMANVAVDDKEYEKVGIYWQFLTNDQYNAVYKDYKAAYADYEAQKKVYDARVELDKAMTEAETDKVSTAEALAVYNNPEATVEQLKAATEALQKAIQDNKINLATPENPYDVTSMYVKNPTFNGNGNNWDFKNDKANGFAYQGSSYTNKYEVEGGDSVTVTIQGFMEHWVAYGECLNDAAISQKLTGIRSGKYILQADCEAFMQSASTEGVASEKGCFLFANGGGDEVRTRVSTEVKKPLTFRVEFTVYDNEATIGFRTEGADCNATAFDNVKLFYCGPAAGAEREQLEGVINKMAIYDVYDNEDTYYYSKDTHNKYADLIAEAQTTLNGTPEAIKAMVAKLAEMETLIKQEVEAYKRLAALIVEVNAENENEELLKIGMLSEIIGELQDQLSTAYNKNEWSIEDIDKAIADHGTMIRDEVARVLKSDKGPGTEITALLVNPNFNTDGDKSGWEGTELGAVRAGAAEQYNKTFDTYQIINDLPHGRYKVEVTGFHRYGTSADAAAVENEDELVTAELYGNQASVKLHGISAGAQNEKIYENDKELGEGSGKYVPNSMEGFGEYIKVINGAWTVSCEAMVTDGTLKIGVRVATNPIKDSWVIFDNFRVTYVGNKVEDYADAIQSACTDLNTTLESYEVQMPTETILAVEELVAQSDAFSAAKIQNKTIEECEKMLDKIAEAKAHLAEVEALINNFNSTLEYYEAATTRYYDGATIECIENMYGKTSWETEKELTDDIASMTQGWTKYVLETEKASEATVEAPVEITPLLRNPSFEWNNGGSDEYWTIENRYTNPSNGITEFYGREKWSLTQTLEGLPAGYYSLTVQACYRSHQELTDVVADRLAGKDDQDVVLFAKSGNLEYRKAIMSILDGGDLSNAELGGNRKAIVPPGETLVTNDGAYTYQGGTELYSPTGTQLTAAYFNYDPEDTGLENQGYWKGNTVVFGVTDGDKVNLGMKKLGHSNLGGNWVPLDNFQLYYMGTTAPAAVKSASAGSVIKGQAYYTVGGLRLSRPQKGVNIIVTTYADGHTTSQKAILK